MFYVLLPSIEYRESLISHLKAQSILSVFHYIPLHLSHAGKKFAARPSNCPVTEDVSDRLLRLPFYNDLSETEQDKVISTVRNFRLRAHAVR
jgi:dTDP-4-amino-4,6-dideoxygalactose transaminase